MKTVLRAATAADADDVMRLLLDLYKGDVGPDMPDLLAEYISSDSTRVTLAAEGGRIVGVLIGSYRLDIDYECRAGIVNAIVVDKEHRRQGLGRRLVQDFAQWAERRGCSCVQVMNGKAEFFERMGFQERPARLHQARL